MDMATEKAGLEIPAEGAVQQAHAHSLAAAAAAADTGELQGMAKRKRASTARDRISKIPPCAAGKRSSIYRGVTRHRWTGRYEAHLWDKSTWNQTQNKKGKQVYLGAYDEEEAAARAYDLAALKYWGAGTLINFPVTDYSRDIEEMQHVSREDYLASLRRKSSGFSRGVSKYRGVARHHQNGRWEARIGRVFGNKYLYLGSYSTQEDAAAAYDIASLEYRGLNGGTNFDLSCYMHWLHPRHVNGGSKVIEAASPHNGEESPSLVEEQFLNEDPAAQAWPGQSTEPYQLPSLGVSHKQAHTKVSYPTALSLLLQSTTFRQMLDKSANNTSTCSDQGIQKQAATASAQYEHSMKGSEGFSQGRHSAFADSKEYCLKSYQATASFSHESQVASLQEEGERAILKPGLSPWQIHPAHAKEFPLANPIPT